MYAHSYIYTYSYLSIHWSVDVRTAAVLHAHRHTLAGWWCSASQPPPAPPHRCLRVLGGHYDKNKSQQCSSLRKCTYVLQNIFFQNKMSFNAVTWPLPYMLGWHNPTVFVLVCDFDVSERLVWSMLHASKLSLRMTNNSKQPVSLKAMMVLSLWSNDEQHEYENLTPICCEVASV